LEIFVATLKQSLVDFGIPQSVKKNLRCSGRGKSTTTGAQLNIFERGLHHEKTHVNCPTLDKNIGESND
jgi:hypothetical protein